jgi:hypothetical protein
MKRLLVRSILPLLLWAVVAAGTTASVRGADVPITLLVDPTTLDVGGEETLEQLGKQPARRLIVPCFVYGETLDATGVAPFQQMPRYKGQRALSQLIAGMHLAGKQVYALVDCLHWTAPGAVPARDILGKSPELAERSSQGDFGPADGGKYASVFHPRVRSALRELVRELAVKHPDLDGLVLRCRLPSNVLLGYSEAARVASIRARQIDPVDILPGPGAAGKVHGEWAEWRIGQATQLVVELSGVFKEALPKARVAVLGTANLQRLSAVSRNNLLEDWLGWAETGGIQEVLLEHPWTEPGAGSIYASCQDRIAATRKAVELTVLLGSWPGKNHTPAFRIPETLRDQAVTGIVVPVSSLEALAGIEPVPASPKSVDSLPSADVRLRLLRTDPRLQIGISGDWKKPSVRELMELLTERTQVPLSLENEELGSRTALGGLSARNQPAWALMHQLAQSEAVQGRWEREGDGYILRPETTPAVPPPASRFRWMHLLVLAGGLLPPLGLVLFVLWRKRHRGSFPSPASNEARTSS